MTHKSAVLPVAIAISLLALTLLTSCKNQRNYASYEDCVLDNVKPSQSQAVVNAIQDACDGKFPPSAEELKASEAQRIAAAAANQAAGDAAQQAADAAAAAADTAAGDAAQQAADAAVAAATSAAAAADAAAMSADSPKAEQDD